MSRLAPTLQAFFTTRLSSQRGASPHTVAAYRDTWRLLLGYVATTTGTPPQAVDFSELDADLVSGFLTHLEAERGNSVATRNARLSAVHSLFSYASGRHPEDAATISAVLAIPMKRDRQRTDITYLTDAGSPGPGDRSGAARPRIAPSGRHDRDACLRADRPAPQRHSPGHRPTRALPRQGTKGSGHTPGPGHGQSPSRVHQRTIHR